MIIEDQELRTLFQAESEEHLQNLDEGLLRLETNPTDARMLDALFRSAHSLKGSAGMLGVTDVEQLAHRFEDALGSAKHGAPLAPDTINRMYSALDAIRKLVRQAVTGESSGVDVERILRTLGEEAAAAASDEAIPATGSEPTDAEAVDSSDGAQRMQTIRVDLRKLDALMTEAGELIVTKTRIARRNGQ